MQDVFLLRTGPGTHSQRHARFRTCIQVHRSRRLLPWNRFIPGTGTRLGDICSAIQRCHLHGRLLTPCQQQPIVRHQDRPQIHRVDDRLRPCDRLGLERRQCHGLSCQFLELTIRRRPGQKHDFRRIGLQGNPCHILDLARNHRLPADLFAIAIANQQILARLFLAPGVRDDRFHRSANAVQAEWRRPGMPGLHRSLISAGSARPIIPPAKSTAHSNTILLIVLPQMRLMRQPRFQSRQAIAAGHARIHMAAEGRHMHRVAAVLQDGMDQRAVPGLARRLDLRVADIGGHFRRHSLVKRIAGDLGQGQQGLHPQRRTNHKDHRIMIAAGLSAARDADVCLRDREIIEIGPGNAIGGGSLAQRQHLRIASLGIQGHQPLEGVVGRLA